MSTTIHVPSVQLLCLVIFGWRFFKSYFTDPKVRKEQERKRKARKKDVDDVDEEEVRSAVQQNCLGRFVAQ